jgi:hypothetical protein
VGFPLAQIISLLEPVAEGRGVGNVVRSFVHLTSILTRGKRILMRRRHTQLNVVNRNRGSNRRIIVLVDIIAIVRNGGRKCVF